LRRAWLFLLPAMAIMGFNAFLPFFYDIYLSLHRYYLITPNVIYLGLTNFTLMVNDETFVSALQRGVLFAFFALAIELPIGFGLGLFLSREFRGRGVLRTILCIPLAIPPIGIGILWLLLTNELGGPIPYIFKHLLKFDFNMTYPAQAYGVTLAMEVWHWTPFVALIMTAAIATIPRELLEAASVDGAPFRVVVTKVVLPIVRFPLLVAILIRLMDNLRIYDEVWMLTGGGPGRTTEFLSLYVVRTLTAAYNIGYGAALSLFFIYLVILLTWLLLQVVQRSE